MNTKTKWNPHLNKDTLGFSTVLVTGLVVTWFTAAASLVDLDAAAAPQQSAQSVNTEDSSRIVITASRLKADYLPQARTTPVKHSTARPAANLSASI